MSYRVTGNVAGRQGRRGHNPSPSILCRQLFGVNDPVMAFIADSPKLLAWSVKARI
jgi:hypothetical protein